MAGVRRAPRVAPPGPDSLTCDGGVSGVMIAPQAPNFPGEVLQADGLQLPQGC